MRVELAGRSRDAGLRVYDTLPGQPDPPCIVIGNPAVTYHYDLGSGASNFALLVYSLTMYVTRADEGEAQYPLDAWLGTVHPGVVPHLEGAHLAAGMRSCYVRTATPSRSMEAGGATLLAADITLDVTVHMACAAPAPQ